MGSSTTETEKRPIGDAKDPEVNVGSSEDYSEVPLSKGIAPSEDDEVVDPCLKDYEIPLVAKCVGLQNDPT